ncbi:MAG: hypothetical protein OET90_00360 [Desulfuromonadales bacterium]|nr:hypothetical protein [Desulfuromonadales bacterium]
MKIREEVLDNGITIVFNDESNRYFGDYHRICIVAAITCPLPQDKDTFWQQARTQLGEQLSVTRSFERMGVASANVETTRQSMIDEFMQSNVAYMQREQYLRSLVQAELSKRKPGRSYGY